MKINDIKDKVYAMTDIIFNFYPQIRSFFRGLVTIKGLDMSVTQLVCLNVIIDNPNITMSELANRLDMSNQQLTKLVDVLVSLEMISRQTDSNNRRQLLVNSTAKGSRTIEMLKNEIYKKLNIYAGKMPEVELEKLVDSLRFINKYFSTLELLLDTIKKDNK